MTLAHLDGFDHYATADILSMYTSKSNAPTITTAGRNSNRMNVSGNDVSVNKAGLPAHGTYIAGIALKAAGIGGNVGQSGFLTFCETGTRHIFLGMTNGLLRVARGDGTQLAISSLVLSTGVWYYIELKVVCSDTVGTVEVRVNGVVWASGTGLDTRNGATGVFNQVEIGSIGNTNGANYDLDDFYVFTGAGSTNNDFFGDSKVELLLPNGDGNSSVLVGSDGNSVNNSLLVDEAPPNGDTDYVESATPGDKDTYAYGNLATTAGTVAGLMVGLYARKTDAGSRSVVSVNRLAATEVDSAVQTLLDSYIYLWDVRETKPGGGAYAIADVNSSEFGMKVNA